MFGINYEGMKKRGNYETSAIAIANLSEARKKKYSHFDNTAYLERLYKEHKFRKTKDKNISYRNKMLERQKIANYKNEIDRINGELSQSIMRGNLTIEHLEKRKEQLNEMIENIN